FTTICSGVCFENFFMLSSLPAPTGAVTEDTLKPDGLVFSAQARCTSFYRRPGKGYCYFQKIFHH
ncbi:hypothetical protein, partial [Arcanobacterium haemolyticum]